MDRSIFTSHQPHVAMRTFLAGALALILCSAFSPPSTAASPVDTFDAVVQVDALDLDSALVVDAEVSPAFDSVLVASTDSGTTLSPPVYDDTGTPEQPDLSFDLSPAVMPLMLYEKPDAGGTEHPVAVVEPLVARLTPVTLTV